MASAVVYGAHPWHRDGCRGKTTFDSWPRELECSRSRGLTVGADIDFDRYRNVMRPHTPAEAAALRDSIEIEGCRDALMVGVLEDRKYLVDGFNRRTVCEEFGKDYRIEERVFTDENELLSWMEKNARGRRNQTRTERNFYIGCRYLREKQPHGGDRRSGKIKSTIGALDSTSARIASEERCSHKHVKACAKMAEAIAELCSAGLDFLKWPILTEQVKYSKKLLDSLLESGAWKHKAEIQALLAEADKVSPKALREAAGIVAEEPDDSPEEPGDPVAVFGVYEEKIHTLTNNIQRRGHLESILLGLRCLVQNAEERLQECS